MNSVELKDGQQVKLNIPFIYTIGEVSPITGKRLKTVNDCVAAVRAELEAFGAHEFAVYDKNGNEIK